MLMTVAALFRGSDIDISSKDMSAPKYVIVEDYGDSLVEKINSVFEEVVMKLYPGFQKPAPLPYVKEATAAKYGDYQFDMSNLISRQVSTPEVKVTSDSVTKAIVENLPKIPLIEKVETVKIFINIFVNKEHLSKRVAGIFAKGLLLPKVTPRKVVIDFSSPNIAKQMHVGHLRSTIIGESISRLLEYMGFSVLRLNHIGDWGTQFGMLIAHLQETFPNYLSETPPIQDLQAFYKESKMRFDEDSDFKKRAYQRVVELQNFEENIVKAWKQICDVSRKDFEQIYARLGVTLIERGESYYQSRMEALVEELDKLGVFKMGDDRLDKLGVLGMKDDRKLLWPPERSTPLTMVKSDGGFTYGTSDMAALKNRLVEEKGEWILYVVDRGQSEHLENVYASARMLGWYDPAEKRVEHVQFGLVLGEDKKKFKTRSGDTVKLTELLDEGLRRAEAKLREKNRQDELSEEEFAAAREAVAYGCIKYADLSCNRTSDYVFSFDKMLNDKGNTAVYLLYAYARIRSIARGAQISREQVQAYIDSLSGSGLPLTDEKEFNLARQILKFSDCLLNVLDSLMLHKITDYLYKLATTYHDFYTSCYVIQTDTLEGTTTIHYHRLVLCEVTADVMLQCFNILGIKAVEKM